MGASPVSNALEHEEHSRLRGAAHVAARILWLALALPTVALTVVGVPLYYRLLLTPCAEAEGSSCAELNGALTMGAVRFLQAQGVSIGVYAALHTVFYALIILTWWIIAFLIFARGSDDVFALVAALFLMFYGVTTPATFLEATKRAYPVLNGAAGYVLLGTTITSIVFFVYFPTLRSAPRWFPFIVALGGVKVLTDILPVPDWLNGVAYLAFYGAVIVAQIYRYRYISTPNERQQTKWVVAGITVATGGVIVLLLLSEVSSLIPSLYTPYLLGESWTILLPLASVAIPITVGVAILRYQLLDIDQIINRALVYGSLTGILAILYLGLVIGAQSVFSNMTDQRGQDPLIIVASTLLIAGLFQPLRNQIQKIIDRRFYRARYDARTAVDAFSATLRQELSLTELRERLIGVVSETMRPTHVSLWLAPPAKERGAAQPDATSPIGLYVGERS